jgi:hypothetical protein
MCRSRPPRRTSRRRKARLLNKDCRGACAAPGRVQLRPKGQTKQAVKQARIAFFPLPSVPRTRIWRM